MTYLSPFTGYFILLTFGVLMVVLSRLLVKKDVAGSNSSFLLANRQVGWFSGAISIAASWIWAPALFVSVQVAYEKGLAGLFWFTIPNVGALLLFTILAPKIREKFPKGFTLPQYILERFQSKKLHRLYLFPYFFYQIMAVTVQLFAGGNVVTLLTGIPLDIVMPLMLVIGLSYTWIGGLKASVLTDVLQMSMIFGVGAIVLPMAFSAGGGWANVAAGFNGIENVSSFLDPHVAFSFGIVTSLGLLAGALSDQQYWQRSFAIKKKALRRSFIVGGFLFGIVPVALSILGFLAVTLNVALPEGIDSSMIGVQTVATLLPEWAVVLFLVMLISGLSSTLDSGFSAASSLWLTDVQPRGGVMGARLSMVGIGLVGWLIAIAATWIPGFGLQHLWWIFNTIAACIMPPTLLSLYSRRITARGAFYGILIAFVLGIPLFVYSNILGDTTWTLGSALFVILTSTLFSLFFRGVPTGLMDKRQSEGGSSQ